MPSVLDRTNEMADAVIDGANVVLEAARSTAEHVPELAVVAGATTGRLAMRLARWRFPIGVVIVGIGVVALVRRRRAHAPAANEAVAEKINGPGPARPVAPTPASVVAQGRR